MNPLHVLFGNESDDDEERIPIDELTGNETEVAIEYLQLINREPNRENIEWAAYQLQADEVPLVSPVESLAERENLDKKLIAPKTMERTPEYQVRNGTISTTLTVTAFPSKVGLGWLVPLTVADANLRLSLHIEPTDQKKARNKLQARYTHTQTSLMRKAKKGRTDLQEDEAERDDLLRILQDVVRGKTKMFQIAVYIELLGESQEELAETRSQIETILAEQDVDTVVLRRQQFEANGSVAPFATDTIDNTHTVQLEALGTLFNLVEPPIYDEDGILLGFDDTSRPVVIDRYAHSGFAAAITGKTGSGKSYCRKSEVYRRMLREPDVQFVLFDPAGDDYPYFAEKLGGEVIRFGGNQKVNPMDLEPPNRDIGETEDTYALTVRAIVEMLHTLFEASGGLPPAEEGMLTQAAHYAYLSKGIVMGQYDTYENESPTIGDLIRGVKIISVGGFAKAFEQEIVPMENLLQLQELDILEADGHLAETPPFAVPDAIFEPSEAHRSFAEALEPKFESFKPGGINQNLNGQTNLDLNSRLVVMDMSSFADTGEMPLILHAMLNWAYLEAKRSPSRFDVTFDEAHYLLGRESTRDLINLFIRHARHYDAGLTLMSQTAHEFLRTPEAHEVYDNCDIKMLFYTQSVAEETREYFDLSPEEVNYLQSDAPRGQASGFSGCLLSSTEHGRRRIEVHTGEFEHHVLDNDLDPWAYIAQQEGSVAPNELAVDAGEGENISPPRPVQEDVPSIDDTLDASAALNQPTQKTSTVGDQ